MSEMLRIQFLPATLVGGIEPELLSMVLSDTETSGFAVRSQCRESGEATGVIVASGFACDHFARRLGQLIGRDCPKELPGLVRDIASAPSVTFQRVLLAARAHARTLATRFYLPDHEAELLSSEAATEVLRSFRNYDPAKAPLQKFVEACLSMWSLGMRRKLGRTIDREKKQKAAPKPVDGCTVRKLHVSDPALLRAEDAEMLQQWMEGIMAEDRELLFERYRKPAAAIADELGQHHATIRKRLGRMRQDYEQFERGDGRLPCER